jgi:hypothetical protein
MKAESSVKKVVRVGSRKNEFDSLFYTRDDIRRQYVLDRYLKRLPKNGKLNTAQSRRTEYEIEVGAISKKHDDEDLEEAYQRGWIDQEDIAKYYKPIKSQDMPPSLLPREKIIMSSSRKSVVQKISKKGLNQPSKRTKLNLDNKADFDKFFDSLAKKEKIKKSNVKLVNKGFSDLQVKQKKVNSLLKTIKNSQIKAKDMEERKNFKILEELGGIKGKVKPMWRRALDAENYKNETYTSNAKKTDERFARGRLQQGMTKDDMKKLEKTLKMLSLKTPLQRNIAELKEKEKARRGTILLGDTPINLKRRRSSGSSVKSSKKSSAGSSTRSRRGSSTSSKISSYGGSRRSSLSSSKSPVFEG